MSDRIKNIVVTISFLLVIISIFLINLIKEDTQISLTERRKLEQFPKFSIKTLLDGSLFEKFEKYTMDQFPAREEFRTLKANVEMSLLKKQDSNNIYQYNGKLVEQLYPLNEKSVVNLTNKMNEIKDKYITNENKVYYTIVPDKNYFVNKNNLKLDYQKLKDIMSNRLKWAQYIEIFDCLELSNYYNTDSHWKQERLQKVVDRIASKMNLKLDDNYEEKKITDFKGVYAGQFPVKIENDEIRVLTNNTIESCIVYNYETNKKTKIYDMDKINAPDKYDIFLSGAAPLISIQNPNNHNDKELIVFRDSYGSSLVPLLVEEYSKITLIDTRYISTRILAEYIDFNDKDILFMYSTSIINNSTSLK